MGEKVTIASLPNEILLRVFEILAGTRECFRLTWPLALTCKRFRVLAQPLIWSDVVLRSDDTDCYSAAMRRSRNLRRSFEAAPDLQAYAKSVALLGHTSIGFTDAVSLVRRFPNTRRLYLHKVENTRFIQKFMLRFECETLEKASPPKGLEGSAVFEELHLASFDHANPEALRNFLKWPAALRVFTVDDLVVGGWDDFYGFEWSYELLASLLSRHKGTLRELRIGQISDEGVTGLNINDFTALEVLQVCCYSLPAPEEACDSWALPTLRRFVVECIYYDDAISEARRFFVQETSEWLKKFAELAMHRKESGSAVLEEIEILYYKDGMWGEMDDEAGLLLEDTSNHITMLGLTVIFTYIPQQFGWRLSSF